MKKALSLTLALILLLSTVTYGAADASGNSPVYPGTRKAEYAKSGGTDNGADTQQPEQAESTKANTSNTLSITKGTEYAYMTDEWNVYIATAISDKIIKVANWHKTMSSSKSVTHDYDVGAFKINDSENGFAWVDDEHTAFVLTFKDKNNSKFKKGGTATFTINITDSNKNKGSDYSEDIACFSYQNDAWHLYRAIPLTETLIKIETWYRSSSSGKFLFGYDLRLIDTASSDTDFEWTDDEHTSFSITMRDEKNKYEWKDEAFVVFILEDEDYTYFDVMSYLGKWEIGDGEAAVPLSASDYKYKDYQDVQKDLEDAGFTNITTKILYDIIWGWTKEGEVKSVSIDGRTDYEKGEVFKKDARIVITYHMKEEDDPKKATSPTNSGAGTGESSPRSQPKELSYSSNDPETAKKGNTGIFSYKRKAGGYDIYWILDFDEGYAYWFTSGNGDSTCDRVAIASGNLNDVVTVTYHDGSSSWSYGLHFKWANQPDHLVMQEESGYTYDFYSTSLSSALRIKDARTVIDY